MALKILYPRICEGDYEQSLLSGKTILNQTYLKNIFTNDLTISGKSLLSGKTILNQAYLRNNFTNDLTIPGKSLLSGKQF